MKLNNKKGISLIVLVITIIVMIILAAAIILSLQSSGIIGRANEAKTKSDAANAKQVLAMASANWQLGEKDGYSEFKPYAESKLNEAGYATGTGKNKYFVTDAGSVIYSGNNTLYVDANGKHAVIPEGFIVSDKTTEDTIAEGLVIYEGTEKASTDTDAETTRNQFVWIPVDNIADFKRKDGYENSELQSLVANGLVSEPCSTIPALSLANDTTGEYAEYTEMRESVEKYGGFYIARYEAGTTQQRTSANAKDKMNIFVQKDKYAYDFVGWGPSMTEVKGDVIGNLSNYGRGAVELSRSMYNTNSVKSTLTYGVQWDAAISFFDDIINPTITDVKYVVNSEGMGYYGNNYASLNDNIKTGIDLKDAEGNILNCIKNIYDMAGNVWEWTMEAESSTYRIIRGNGWGNPYADYAVSGRWGDELNDASSDLGFRPALYLK